VGKRELIGLAAAAQLGPIPAWLGIACVQGFDTSPLRRLLSFLGNVLLIVASSGIVYRVVLARAAHAAGTLPATAGDRRNG
jgi:hypothetical protein